MCAPLDIFPKLYRLVQLIPTTNRLGSAVEVSHLLIEKYNLILQAMVLTFFRV